MSFSISWNSDSTELQFFHLNTNGSSKDILQPPISFIQINCIFLRLKLNTVHVQKLSGLQTVVVQPAPKACKDTASTTPARTAVKDCNHFHHELWRRGQQKKIRHYLFFTDLDCLGRISLAVEENFINGILFFHSIIHIDNLECRTKQMAFVNACL